MNLNSDNVSEILNNISNMKSGDILNIVSSILTKSTITETNIIPATEIIETKDTILIVVELPGVKKTDIKINLSGTKLEIITERKKTRNDKDSIIHINEIRYGNVNKIIKLPIYVSNRSSLIVDYIDGILNIKIDKRNEEKTNISITL
jgi:HSP20 family protein